MTANSKNDMALAQFLQDAQNKKAANAYLLTGPKAQVLQEHAHAFLLALFCEKKNRVRAVQGVLKSDIS